MSAKSTIKPLDCTVFINIWVDIEADRSSDPTAGFYMVDNQGLSQHPSTNEGTPSLNTKVGQGAKVCWIIRAIDPAYEGTLSISDISQGTFGFAQPPGVYNNDKSIWTGQMIQNSQTGSIKQSITCQSSEWDSGSTVKLEAPSITLYN